MKKTTLVPVAVTAFLAVILFFSGGAGTEALAQRCCSYTVRISALIPANCLPVRLDTRWGAGKWSTSHSSPGTYTVTPTAPFPPCPPNYLGNLLGASIDNFNHGVGPNQCLCLPSGVGNCRLQVCTYQDVNGCWIVQVEPC